MKLERTDPCPCGSGKTYEKCCQAWREASALKASMKKVAPGAAECNQLAALLDAGRLAELESRARLLLEQYPDSGFVWNLLGVSLQMQGKDGLPALQNAAKFLPNDAEVHSNLGNALGDLGRYEEAEASYRRALQINPYSANAHCNLGITLKDLGRLEEAEASYRRALQIKPNVAEVHNSLGNILRKLGRLDEAEASYRRVLQIKPDIAEVHANMGNILNDLGQPGEAEASYRRALQIKPDIAEVHNMLGHTLRMLGRLDEAEASCRRALEIKPDLAEAHSNLSFIFHQMGRLGDAEASSRRALEIKPDFVEAQCNLGVALFMQNRLPEAEACFRRALQLKPDFADAHCMLGSVLKRQGRFSDTKACYRKAKELGSNSARIFEALMLPAIMGTRQEMLESRAEFERNLNGLIADKVTLEDPLTSIGETNFYLAYHGLNDRDLQVKVAKFYAQACPSLLYAAPHCAKPKSDNQKKIRVGFFSRFLYSHSVSLCFSKIIEALSLKERFEVVLISNRPVDEKIYSGFAGTHVRLPNRLEPARKILAALELDVLVYLDIGMEAMSYFLAFSRLAKLQCVLAGHPVTTGIANVDYFLSSELMEPLGADEHYSEKLVRLPRPLFYFTRPILPAIPKTRRELGLPDNRHIYMCPMRQQKIHPDFDEAITRILQIDGDGAVVLFEDIELPFGRKLLEKRFENTIPADVRERVIFLPWLNNPNDFISAIAAADVILDPFHFGIGSTAIATFATGTPLVTRTGEFMRGRVGACLCRMLDLAECITESTEDYAQKAVMIARDQSLREKISAKMLKNNFILYENMQPIEDLIGFFYQVTDGGYTA